MSRLPILALAAAILGLGSWYLSTPPSTPSGSAQLADQLVGAAHAQDAELDTSTIAEMRLGNPDAPVTVIEYASYTCPHCASFHGGTFKQLKSDFIETGKINFVYREVYFDRYGLWASAIARCAGTPDSFFGITDILYQQQSEWTRAGEPADIVAALRKIGAVAGLDGDTLEACLQDGQKLRTLVQWYTENAETDGIRSTPSFVIDGTTYNNMSFSEMADLINDASGS
ncbi:MAG: DsbA family protein [Paracoccaceae bacterium]